MYLKTAGFFNYYLLFFSIKEDEATAKEKHDKKVENRITTYRKLLQSIEEEEKEEKEKYEMEITWDPSKYHLIS